ncbi:MAG: 5-oxoprolinase, partial [Acidobacteria bacterium]
YGEGGPLTLTDVNLLAGRLDPDALGIPLDPRAARDRLDDLVEQIAGDLGTRPDPDEVLDGLLEIANLRMADAIRAISIRRGHDPRGDTLVAFGGAGGQHACAIAERLGLRRVLVPPDAGLLSAHGLAAAPVERIAERQVLAPLDAVIGDLDRLAAALEREARDTLRRETGRGDATAVDRRLSVRFAGQGDALDVPLGRGVDPVQEFLARYRALYGHLPAGRALEAVAVRVVARAAGSRAAPPARHDAETAAHVERAPRRSGRTLRMRAGGTIHEAPVLDRAGLVPGEPCTGPAIVVEPHGTTVVEPGWTLAVDASTGALRLARDRRAAPGPARSDLVAQELFVHRLEQVAREMGEALRRTAVSTNVRERLDYSCAVLDRDGRLLANAPHIPVHLGSLGMCVRSVDAALGGLAPGEFAVTNHPAHGGSHLPDVTVILAVGDGHGRRIGFAATRAHHAEIGGRLPGSMPPTARRLAEEGVVIPPTRLGTVDAITTDALRRLFVAGPWPSRCPDDNVADLEAAIAACHRGGEALAALARATGTRRFEERAARLRAHAARLAARALARIPPGRREATEVLDSGARLTVRWEIDAGRARITFPDAPPLDPGSLNATPAIVASTVIYVLRVMVDEPLPLNEGLLERVDLVIPPGMLAPEFPEDPAQAPAVVGGNVELSQRLVDASLRALGLCAASQGTMNNVLFGDAGFSYYETIGGGAGAGPDFDGASAVQVHMTNTRITDPEVLEHRHPAAVRRFAVRRGSGGAGRRRGGDGIVRELEFLAPLTLSVLGEHRVRGPSGERGGADGAPARVALHRARGPVRVLRSADAAEVGPGDRLVVETPGGGGWGAPE